MVWCAAIALGTGCGGVQPAKEPVETIVVNTPSNQEAGQKADQSGPDAAHSRDNSKTERERVELAVVGFLDYLKSQAPPVSDRFRPENGGTIDIEQLLKYFPQTGVVISDANREAEPKQFSLEDLRKESAAGRIDQGSATRQLLHLGYIAAHPQPQYSRLQYETVGNSEWLVRVANWYELKLRANNASVVIERVDYVMGEDL